MQVCIYFKIDDSRNIDYLKGQIQKFINQLSLNINKKGVEIPVCSVLTDEELPYTINQKHLIGIFLSGYQNSPIILQAYFSIIILLAKHFSEKIKIQETETTPVYLDDMIYFPTTDKAVLSDPKAYPNFIDEDRFSEAAALFPFIQRLLFKLEGQEAVTEIEIIKEEIDKSFKDLKF